MVLKPGPDRTVRPKTANTKFFEQANKDYKRERERDRDRGEGRKRDRRFGGR